MSHKNSYSRKQQKREGAARVAALRAGRTDQEQLALVKARDAANKAKGIGNSWESKREIAKLEMSILTK